MLDNTSTIDGGCLVQWNGRYPCKGGSPKMGGWWVWFLLPYRHAQRLMYLGHQRKQLCPISFLNLCAHTHHHHPQTYLLDTLTQDISQFWLLSPRLARDNHPWKWQKYDDSGRCHHPHLSLQCPQVQMSAMAPLYGQHKCERDLWMFYGGMHGWWCAADERWEDTPIELGYGMKACDEWLSECCWLLGR